MTATESAYSELIAKKLLDQMPEAISKLRPNSEFVYEFNADDMQIFEEYPNKLQSIIQRAVAEACKSFWAEFKHRDLEGIELEQAIIKDKLAGRNDGLDKFNNIKVKLQFYPTVEMRDIGPKIENKPIVVDGRIIAVSDKRGYIVSGAAFCPSGCDTDCLVYCGPTLRTFLPKCSDCKQKMHLRANTAKTDYVQTIRIQELENDTRKPITFDVKITGDDVFNTWIGKRVRIAGSFITDIVMEGNKQEHKQFIFAKYMHEIEEVNNVCMTEERAAEIREQLKQKDNITKLFKSFAPRIEGKLLQKESILYSFVGGTEDEVRRIDINVLEIGNAGEGKSELIKQIPRVIAKSRYFLGNNATAAGLGIGMVKLDNQTSVPQGGPLVQCSPHGVLALDELDKMHTEDQNALLSSMENQIVSKTVAGVDLILPSLVTVCAAANPKFGNWDESKGVANNINFPPYLLTRFDIVSCSVKTNPIKKQAIASKILGLEPVTTEQSLEPLLTEEELMQYINYCKKRQPRLTQEARRELKNFYEVMSELTEDEDKVVPMTPRELEGMIRLTTARAKLLQKEFADMDDVEAIKKLKTDAITSFPGITVKGAGQQLSLLTEMDKKEKSKEDVIFECMDEDKLVDSGEVVKKWVEAGIFKTEQRAEREFQSMVGQRFYLRGSKYKYAG